MERLLMKIHLAALLASAALILPGAAFAQTTPTFNASSPFDGRLSSYHQGCLWFQPKAGDYGRTETDAPGGVARACALAVVTVDATGTIVNPGGGGGSNAAAGTTGTTVPGSASYTGFNSAGNLVGVSSANPFPITNGSLTTLAGAVGTTGSTIPTTPVAVGGKDGSGNLEPLRTDTFGGMIGGQMTGTPTRTTLTASASTALPGATSTTRPSYLRVTVETTLAANLFLCLSNQTCSATVYDEMIPSGATAGTRLFEELPFTSAVTYFTTGTPTVNVARLAN